MKAFIFWLFIVGIVVFGIDEILKSKKSIKEFKKRKEGSLC